MVADLEVNFGRHGVYVVEREEECVWDLFENYHLRCLLIVAVVEHLCCAYLSFFDHQQRRRSNKQQHRLRTVLGEEEEVKPENMGLDGFDPKYCQRRGCHFC